MIVKAKFSRMILKCAETITVTDENSQHIIKIYSKIKCITNDVGFGWYYCDYL